MKTIVVLLFTLCSFNTFGQFYSIDKATLAEIENHGVIFELLPESENDIPEVPAKKKANKKNETADDYPEFNKTLNDAAKRSLAKYWKLTKGTVEFKTQKEISVLALNDVKNKVIITCGWITKDTKYQGMLYLYSFHIKYVNSENKEAQLFEFEYTPYTEVNDADIIFFAKTMTQIKEVSMKYEVYKESHVFTENIKIVESKTLLADSALLGKKSGIEDITKVYPHKFEITSKEVIEKAIIDECDTCMFFKPVYSKKNGMLMFDVFDTKDMKILAAIGTGGVTFKLGAKPGMRTTYERKFSPGSGGGGYYYYDSKTTHTPINEIGTGGKTLWKSPMTIGPGHFKLILSEGAQKMNFK